MDLRKIIRTDIAASAFAHLTLVALVIVISEVHPFHAAPPETVTVDIVTPEQVKEEEAKAEEKFQEEGEDKTPEPLPDLKLPKLDIADKADAAPKPADQPQASPQPSQQAPQQNQPQPTQAPQPRQASAPPQQLQQAPPPQAMPQQQSAAPPAYQAPQPDVTVKYGVMLGLPPELPTELQKDLAKVDGGDAKDTIAAKLPPEVIAALRRHLRSCARLPAGVDPTDQVNIKLRAVFATDGTLLREPVLMAAPPSAKGVALVKSAMSALQNCQPYKMLPADKYAEWKVLDLPFSPRDFGS